MIVSLLAKEKRTIAGNTKGDPQPETALYSRNNRSKSTKDKRKMECHYCKKMGHTALDHRSWANDVLNRKLKDESNVVNVVIIEDPSDSKSGDELTKMTLFVF